MVMMIMMMPEQDSNPDLCEAVAVLHQLSYQANWELVIMCVYDKPVDGGYTRSFNEISFELRKTHLSTIYVSIHRSNEISSIKTSEQMANTFCAAVDMTT